MGEPAQLPLDAHRRLVARLARILLDGLQREEQPANDGAAPPPPALALVASRGRPR